jgi:SAM-dependent methyltransferase
MVQVRPAPLVSRALPPRVIRVATSLRRRTRAVLGRGSAELPHVDVHVSRFCHLDGVLRAEGWAYCAASPIVAVGIASPKRRRLVAGYGHRSTELVEIFGPAAERSRFRAEVAWADGDDAAHAHLFVRLADGREVDLEHAIPAAKAGHRFGAIWVQLLQHLEGQASGRILELGSRGEAGMVYRAAIPAAWDYVGVDLLPGPNVDVVADAHELSRHVARESFDALFSVATFEHLAMPWKVAVEINKVLKPGGIAAVVTHQAWPVHEQPWDYWRFSTWAWRAMFNEVSGFEVVEAAMGEPARIVPELLHPTLAGVARGEAYLGSAALVRKIGSTRLRWDVPTSAVADGTYPSLALTGYDGVVAA